MKEQFNTSTVKEELYKELLSIDPRTCPVKYLDILDQYEKEDMRVRQIERRKKLLERLHYEDPMHM